MCRYGWFSTVLLGNFQASGIVNFSMGLRGVQRELVEVHQVVYVL